MATKLFLRSTTGNGIGAFKDMLSAAGAGSTTGVVNSAASGTEIQWTATAGGAVLEWISGRVPSGGFTLAGTMTFSVWCHESNAQANCGARARVFKRTAAGSESEIAGGPWNDGVEFGTAAAEMVWTGAPTSTAFAENDRIIVRIYITNIGTMGGSRTCTLTYNAADAATGDSFFQINETVAFKSEAQSAAPGISTETDAALGLGAAMGAGRAEETDAALARTGAYALAAGRADETDAALATTSTTARAPGLATELDASVSPGGTMALAAGRADEADAALAPVATTSRSAERGEESDEALAPGALAARAPGPCSSTEEALALGQSMGPGISLEVDAALALDAGSTNTHGRADETDAALAPGATLIREAGLAAEADVALFLAAMQARYPGVAEETDAALPLQAGGQSIASEEVDEALGPGGLMGWTPGISTELDLALALTMSGLISPPPDGRSSEVVARSRGADVTWPDRASVVGFGADRSS